jgi:hypothetical protein
MNNYNYANNNSFFQKVGGILKNKGFSYLIKKTFNRYIFPLYLKFHKKDTFIFKVIEYEYFYHPYNLSWANVRAVELPILIRKLKSYEGKAILEIGNGLSHYMLTQWDIVDKYEKDIGVINEDVVNFKSQKKYELIISISTLEHVGFDESPKDPGKILIAIENLRKNCLREGGEIIVTLPVGYNPEMDKLLFLEKLGFDKKYYMKRISWNNKWKQATIDELKMIKNNPTSIASDGLVIGYIKKSRSSWLK